MDAENFLSSTTLDRFNELSEKEQKEVINILEKKYLSKISGSSGKKNEIKEVFNHTGDTDPTFTGASDVWSN